MRIGLGALTMSDRPGVRQSGIYQYSVNLIEHLPAALEPDELVVYSPLPGSRYAASSSVHYQPFVALHNPAIRVLWEQTVLPSRLRLNRIGLYHGLAFVLPKLARLPKIVTIHDLAFMRWPDLTTQRRSRYLSRQVQDAVNQSTRVIAVSEHTKKEIVDLLGIDPQHIDVTPLGVDPIFRRSEVDAIESFCDRQGLRQPFILAVGNLEPRKNLDVLVRAFAEIANEFPHHLVLAGARGWKPERLEASIAASGVRERIRLPGFIPRAELPLWYSACDVFAIPSFDEGFGLPLLEALACGAPAVSSNRGALPEIAGQAAILVDPDVRSFAEAMSSLIRSKDIQARLRREGPIRAEPFTWQRTAELTVQSYRKALR